MDSDHEQQEDTLPDEDVSLPRQTVAKLVQELMPDNFTCPRDSRDLLVACCTDLVHLVASEANDVCEKAHKKTITAEHFMEALRNLGFGEYCLQVEQALQEQQEAARQRLQHKRRDADAGAGVEVSEEELGRQQAELFEQARLKYMTGSGV